LINENIYQELKNGIENLEKNIDKFAPGSCEITTLKVLKDTRVQEAFVKLIIQGYDFDQPSCKGEHDQIKVTFMFRCRSPRICIIHPYFVVTYDLSLHKLWVTLNSFPDCIK
jgi:hypothetical protein